VSSLLSVPRPAPGCPLCLQTWRRRATVFDQLGFSSTTKSWYYRCVGCDTRWSATLDTIRPMNPSEPLPGDRDAPRREETGPAVDSTQYWIGAELLPEELPRIVSIGPVVDRRWDGGKLLIPFPELLQGSWVGTPLQSRIAPLAALCLALDVIRDDVDQERGACYTFELVSYIDELGHLHAGYGRHEHALLDLDTLRRGARVSVRESLSFPPDPAERLVLESGVSALGPGVHAPTLEPMNRVVFDASAPTALSAGEPSAHFA
jgi:hypothetical protein